MLSNRQDALPKARFIDAKENKLMNKPEIHDTQTPTKQSLKANRRFLR